MRVTDSGPRRSRGMRSGGCSACAASPAFQPCSRALGGSTPSLVGPKGKRATGLPRRKSMLDRLGLPRPQIATKLYGAVALTLAVVYLLAAGIIHFASQTEHAVGLIRQDALQALRLSHNLESSLERQRQLLASAPLDFDADASA